MLRDDSVTPAASTLLTAVTIVSHLRRHRCDRPYGPAPQVVALREAAEAAARAQCTELQTAVHTLRREAEQAAARCHQVQYSVQYSAAQYHLAQYSTVQSSVQDPRDAVAGRP